MRYKWKPNASQKAEYRQRCIEKEKLNTKITSHAIRNGCKLKYYSLSKGKIIEGEVISNSYGRETNQHTFTILTNLNEKILVKGRNLYPNIIEHIPGELSRLA